MCCCCIRCGSATAPSHAQKTQTNNKPPQHVQHNDAKPTRSHACTCKQEQQQCIRETQVLSAFDSDFVVRFWDAFLEQVMGGDGCVCGGMTVGLAGGGVHRRVLWDAFLEGVVAVREASTRRLEVLMARRFLLSLCWLLLKRRFFSKQRRSEQQLCVTDLRGAGPPLCPSPLQPTAFQRIIITSDHHDTRRRQSSHREGSTL